MASTQKGKNDPELCPRCTDVATNLCVICKNIKYCSPECQQADWASHKSLCKSFKDFAGPRPASNMRRVVVFLPEEDKPRFMWAPLSDDGRGSMCTLPHEFLDYKPKPLFWKQLTTSTNVWTGKKLGYVVQVWYDDNFVMNFQDVEPPPALQAATQGLEKTEWRGPMVTCCHGLPKEDWDDGEDDSHPLGTVKTSDMDMRAYSQATSMIIDHGNEKARQFCKGPKLQCIEVACGEDGEGTGPHRVIHMPRTHPKLREPEASEVSKVLLFLFRNATQCYRSVGIHD